LSIENGNPTDTALFLSAINAHQQLYDQAPKAIVCDGGYASKSNVEKGRAMGVKRVVFHKRVGISYTAMGVQIKTFENYVIFARVSKGIFLSLNVPSVRVRHYRKVTMDSRRLFGHR
jgi:hypothetical protein